MIHEYKIPIEDFLGLFNVPQNTIDLIDEAIREDIEYSFSYYFTEFDWETAKEIVDRHVKYTKSVPEYVLDEIEAFFNNQVDDYFDDPIKMTIKGIDYSTDTVSFTIETENLKHKIGQGMDAYGMWNWSLHSPEDQQSFVDDGHLALRELLHYYEACCSKPKINWNASGCDFWEYDTTIEQMEEEINEAQSKLD